MHEVVDMFYHTFVLILNERKQPNLSWLINHAVVKCNPCLKWTVQNSLHPTSTPPTKKRHTIQQGITMTNTRTGLLKSLAERSSRSFVVSSTATRLFPNIFRFHWKTRGRVLWRVISRWHWKFFKSSHWGCR